jgi:hypothetical protein
MGWGIYRTGSVTPTDRTIIRMRSVYLAVQKGKLENIIAKNEQLYGFESNTYKL